MTVKNRLMGMLCLTLSLVVLPAIAARAQQVQVTITNLTENQTFTPIMVATHKPGLKLFTPGQPANVDLEEVAEAGDVSFLEATLRADPRVRDVTDSAAPLPPGQSVTLTLPSGRGFGAVSVVAMLVPTNDGFFALNGEAGPEGPQKSVTYYSPAYDAGGEANDELCVHIPGPSNVCTGEGFNASREGDVNFVHIHPGIHGVGDLSAAMYDWRNPVAKIVITRVH